jgi:hypothetical protein
MSRFGDDNEEGLPWELWQNVMSRVLIGKKAQTALAEIEEALLALPDRRIIRDHLAADGSVCAVGLYCAKRRADQKGIDLTAAIAEMQDERDGYESSYDTMLAGRDAGMDANLAWHLGFLNDEEWHSMTPEQRYERLLSFVQNALGRESVAA